MHELPLAGRSFGALTFFPLGLSLALAREFVEELSWRESL